MSALLPVPFVFGQHAHMYNLSHISEENGLSDDRINCIYKDSKNFLWIGTSSGLNLLNGSGITLFLHQPGKKNSISGNDIRCIAEDPAGGLWIGTREGLNFLDPLLKVFSRVPLKTGSNDNKVLTKAMAISATGQLYVATETSLYKYDPKGKTTELLELPGRVNERVLNNEITKLCFDKNGILWLTTHNGLWSYNPASNLFSHEISESNCKTFPGLYTTFIIDHLGIVWLGTWQHGLHRFDPRTKVVTAFQADGVQPDITGLAEIRLPDSNYRILITDPLLSFNPLDKQFDKFLDNDLDCKTLLAGEERLWLGTQSGLYSYKLNQPDFTVRHFNKKITSQGISFFEWNGRLMVGAADEYFLKEYNHRLQELNSFAEKIKIKNIDCLTIKSSGTESLKCGTTDGIADINLASNTVHFTRLHDPSANDRQLNFITCLLHDSHQRWWVFPWRNGIWYRDAGEKNFHKIRKNFISIHGRKKELVVSGACEDKNGNIWMSDLDEGIIFYNRKRNRLSKPFSKVIGTSLSCSQILYYRGNCYSFSDHSLFIWNVDSMVLHSIPLFAASDKPIQSIAIDSSGFLWIAALNSLIARNPGDGTFVNFYSHANGLPVDKFNGTLFCCHDGTMVYGGENALFSFRPRDLLSSPRMPPKSQLEAVEVNGQPTLFDLKSVNHFGYDAHNFIFHWTVTDYDDPLNNRYYYKLEGLDDDWRYVGKTGIAHFANLSSGSYTLLLKGQSAAGFNADKILTLQFSIAPVFWRTWWFLSVLGAALGAFFYTLYQYRLNQLKRVENIRNKISMNLHDEIGSTLSSISILSEMVLHRKPDDSSARMLEEIKENSMTMMESMDDIVWSINPRNDSLENLFIRIRAFAAGLFEARDIQYSIMISDDIKNIHPGMELRRNIYLLMKEGINNLVKYSGCTEATMHVHYSTPLLKVEITDNGRGFDPSAVSDGNGLYSMKKRAAEMGARLEIQSGCSGTVISLAVKIK